MHSADYTNLLGKNDSDVNLNYIGPSNKRDKLMFSYSAWHSPSQPSIQVITD